jgi:hypothetical protein
MLHPSYVYVLFADFPVKYCTKFFERMKVTVATLSDTVFTLDVSDDLEIENFKVRITVIYNIKTLLTLSGSNSLRNTFHSSWIFPPIGIFTASTS